MALSTVLPKEKDGCKLCKAEPGSVSYGTLRTEDLIETFLNFLGEYNHPYAIGLREECEGLTDDDLDVFLNENIWEAMQDLAPDNHYFGSHPGDGSDFGYWEFEEEVEEEQEQD